MKIKVGIFLKVKHNSDCDKLKALFAKIFIKNLKTVRFSQQMTNNQAKRR